MSYSLEPIAYVKSCFPEKFGIPRQSLLCPSAVGQLILLPPYNEKDAVDGLEQVSHLWLTFIFHQHINKTWKPKVRPPRLGGNKKVGVFATRSSFRPNNIGLSVVKLDRIECVEKSVTLHISGLDLLDGTPIVDIKPYVPYADNVKGAVNTIAPVSPKLLPVIFLTTASVINDIDVDDIDIDGIVDNYVSESVNDDFKKLITEVLQQDPKPAYHEIDPHRIYSMYLKAFDIKWRYQYDEKVVLTIYVVSIEKISSRSDIL